MREDIAILTDDNFAVIRHTTRELELYAHDRSSYTNIGMIADKASDLHVYNIWIAPYTDISGMFVKLFVTSGLVEYRLKASIPDLDKSVDDTYMTYLKVYKLQGKDITFTIPEFNYLWKLDAYDDISPIDIAHMLATLRDALPVHIVNSPTYIGIKLLEQLADNQEKSWFRAMDSDLPDDLPLATNLVWKILGAITKKKYIHVVDKNGAYLSSYQSTLVGTGNVTHYDIRDFDRKKVGIWHVTLSSNTSLYNGIDLPLPYNSYANNWLWTPEIDIAVKLGYQVNVQECWLWSEAHYVFRKWSKFIWNTRTEVKELADTKKKQGYYMAYDMIKHIYTETSGRLAHTGNDYDRKDVYSRIDWFSMIVADTRLKVLVMVHKLLALGYYPVMVSTDALYYLSDEKDIRLAIPGILDRDTSLGGYKHKYSTEFSNVEELFDNGASANQISERLNQLHKELRTW